MLGTFVLTLHDYTRRHMGNSYSRIGFINMLTALTAGAKSIDTQIVFVNFNFYFIINFRINKNGGERCMTARVGVKGEMRTNLCMPISALA